MAVTTSTRPAPRPLPGAAPAATLAFRAPRRDELLRRLRLPLAAAGVLVAALLFSGASVDPAVDLLRRLLAADHAWLAAAVGLEVASFAGYVVLLWAVAGRAAPAFGLGDAYRTTVAGAAATRLLPTAGAGGAALTLWVLRRAGARDAARTLMTFLAVLYGVFLLAVLGAGVAVALAGRPEVGVLPAALAAGAFVVAAGLARGRGGRLGPGIADAAALVRTSRDPRLLGAVAWWGFDVAVLGAAVHAVGGSLAVGTLVLAYVLGQVANTLPLPGAASTGLVGLLVLLGTDVGTAVAAVLCYRAVAIWLPAPAGLVALLGLRRRAGGYHGDRPRRDVRRARGARQSPIRRFSWQ